MQNPQISSLVNNQPQLVSVNAVSFGAKCSSKREVFRFLTSEAKIYLPAYETVTVFHMRDIVAGKRKMIKQSEVRVISVPFFEGLSIEKMLEWSAGRVEGVMEVFPIIKREVDKLPRAYIANCIFTLTGQAFQNWVTQQVNERNAKVAREKDTIQMDPAIAAIYMASTSVSGKYIGVHISLCPLIIAILI